MWDYGFHHSPVLLFRFMKLEHREAPSHTEEVELESTFFHLNVKFTGLVF